MRLTDQQLRERALYSAIARAQMEHGCQYDKDAARLIGMTASTYYRYKREAFQGCNFWTFSKIARKLHLKDYEVCACLGIPYEGGNER